MKQGEDTVSMFLGLVIVVVVIGLIFNFVQKRKGSVEVPGINSSAEEKELEAGGNKEENKNIYEVGTGESLWMISEKIYGSGNKWVELARINGLKNPNIIHSGNKLILSSAPVKTDSYVVKRGDSLWKIAVNLYGDGYKWTEIWNANRNLIGNPNQIEIGMSLAISK